MNNSYNKQIIQYTIHEVDNKNNKNWRQHQKKNW